MNQEPQKTNTLKVVLMTVLLIIFGTLVVYYFATGNHLKENKNALFIEEGDKLDYKSANPADFLALLEKKDCWITEVNYGLGGEIISTDYYCFATHKKFVSTYYNAERDFKTTSLDVREHHLDDKAAFIALGMKRFCLSDLSHDLCVVKKNDNEKSDI